jgi:hypothetical protein
LQALDDLKKTAFTKFQENQFFNWLRQLGYAENKRKLSDSMIEAFAENNVKKLEKRKEKDDVMAWVFFLHEEMHQEVHHWVPHQSQWVKSGGLVKLQRVYLEMSSPKIFPMDLPFSNTPKRFADVFNEEEYNVFLNLTLKTTKEKMHAEVARKLSATYDPKTPQPLDGTAFEFNIEKEDEISQTTFYRRFTKEAKNASLPFYQKSSHYLPAYDGTMIKMETPESSENEETACDKIKTKKVKKSQPKKRPTAKKDIKLPSPPRDFRKKTPAEIVKKAAAHFSNIIDDEEEEFHDSESEEDTEDCKDTEDCEDSDDDKDTEDEKEEKIRYGKAQKKKDFNDDDVSSSDESESDNEDDEDKCFSKTNAKNVAKRGSMCDAPQKKKRFDAKTSKQLNSIEKKEETPNVQKSTDARPKRKKITPERYKL